MMKKHEIIYGECQTPLQRNAIKFLSESLLDYLYEYPACVSLEEHFAKENTRKIYIGTKKTNPAFSGASFRYDEEYCITVRDDDVYIEGYDDLGVLYGCVDFFARYLTKLSYPNDDRYVINPLEGKLPDWNFSSHPAVKHRGLWTWGHVLYDYRGYLENMARLKLNTLTIWNDHVPLNAKELVEYAHGLGIRVIFGYSWLWSTDCKTVPFDRLTDFSESIFEKYEREYAPLHPDGIYFQSATELHTEAVGGTVIAEAVTAFVNHTASLFFEKYPDLELQFGLHATSVKNRLSVIRAVDPRIRIVWEDVGAFPFSYFPCDVENTEETDALVRNISVLRGESDRFGAVTKGLTKLDWSSFSHLPMPLYIGASSEAMKQNRMQRKRPIWKYVQAYWIAHADLANRAVKLMKDIKKGELYISALLEDGMFEREIMYPAALFAEMLWDPEREMKALMSDVALRSDVIFA